MDLTRKQMLGGLGGIIAAGVAPSVFGGALHHGVALREQTMVGGGGGEYTVVAALKSCGTAKTGANSPGYASVDTGVLVPDTGDFNIKVIGYKWLNDLDAPYGCICNAGSYSAGLNAFVYGPYKNTYIRNGRWASILVKMYDVVLDTIEFGIVDGVVRLASSMGEWTAAEPTGIRGGFSIQVLNSFNNADETSNSSVQGCEITVGNTLVFNGIPVIRNADGVAGLLNQIDGVFHAGNSFVTYEQ